MINSYSKVKFYDDESITSMIQQEVSKCVAKGENRKYTDEMTIELIKLRLSKIFTELKVHLNAVYELEGNLYVRIRQGYIDSLRESNLIVKVKK